MRRREFIAGLGGAVAWSVVARAQQPPMPVIGYLTGTGRSVAAGFRRGLGEAGYVEGKNVVIEYRSAAETNERLPALAAELVSRPVDVIFAVGGSQAVLAAKAATSTIPIVFGTGADPVERGFVASLNRPGGNVTGVTTLTVSLAGKRLGLLRDVSPKTEVVGFLVNPKNLNTDLVTKDMQAAAGALGLRLIVIEIGADSDFEPGFATLVRQHADAFVVESDALLLAGRRDRIVALAQRHAIPAIYPSREDAETGGLMSYGTSNDDGFRQCGIYVGRILKGAKPADLPVLQPTKFELVINRKTAKALGLTVPEALLATADQVIE
jgi:putative tryptophan/tyrosine transport system substrate-binding protein